MTDQLPDNVLADNKDSRLGIVPEVTCLECGYIGPMAKTGTAYVRKGNASNVFRIIGALLALAFAAAFVATYQFAALFLWWFYVPTGIALFLLYKCLPDTVPVVRCPTCRNEITIFDS